MNNSLAEETRNQHKTIKITDNQSHQVQRDDKETIYDQSEHQQPKQGYLISERKHSPQNTEYLRDSRQPSQHKQNETPTKHVDNRIDSPQQTNDIVYLKDSLSDPSPTKDLNLSTREKLADQNNRLKQQILELAQCLDEIVEREKQKKPKKFGINPEESEDPEDIKKQKHVIKQQQVEIERLKNLVKVTNRQLEMNFDNQKITNKEDELRNLQQQLEALLSEQKSLKGIQKNQVNALSSLNNEEENKKRQEFLQSQLREVRKKNRELNGLLQESEVKLKEQHQIHFQKQNKIKQIDEKIHEHKKKTKSHQLIVITEEECEILENRLQELTQENIVIQKQYKDQMKTLEKDKRDIWKLAEKKEMQLKEKEKELKINQLRFKEMARLVRHNALQPIKANNSSIKQFELLSNPDSQMGQSEQLNLRRDKRMKVQQIEQNDY